MKMAFGENPKRTYGGRHQTPDTRMGAAWLVRQEFQRARELRDKQDRWCKGLEKGDDVATLYPVDLSLQTLVDILRGKVKLNVHVYTVRLVVFFVLFYCRTFIMLMVHFSFPLQILDA